MHLIFCLVTYYNWGIFASFHLLTNYKGRMSKYLCLEDGKPYHTSAVYASAIHSISLPFRMQPLGPSAQSIYTSGAVNMKELVQMLAGQGHQNMVTVLDVAMPAPAFTGTIYLCIFDCLLFSFGIFFSLAEININM